jgi:UDP-N-acetylmuramoylalanine--D-glutamate ligase
MKVAVVGLGIEGTHALHSLLDFDHQVYASDLNEDLNIPMDNYDGGFEIELGRHNWDKINSADAVVVSPSLWKRDVLKKITSPNKIFSRVLGNHRDIFTIGVTGTNGKTTTALMIKDILTNSGFKVLVGGNAGGGFDGYTRLMLEASQDEYDYLIVEVCDMTLDFSRHNFHFDLVVVTNLGWDHINVHHSMEQYQERIYDFIKDKTVVLNKNDDLLSSLKNKSFLKGKPNFFDTYNGKLNLIGKYNRMNAGAAFTVSKILNIPEDKICESLSSFKPVDGRITELKLGDSRIIIGKTDNVSAVTAVFQETKFDLAILGTPRREEYWRFDIFIEVANFNPPYIVLFPGLDDTTSQAKEILEKNSYKGKIRVSEDIFEIVDFISTNHGKYRTIFIGGNGQDKITQIKRILKGIS